MPKDWIAIVIGDDHYNALGVIRSLGKVRMEIHFIIVNDDKITFSDKSKYITRCYHVKKEEILDTIEAIVNTKYEYFIFPLSDFYALLVDSQEMPHNVHRPNMNGKMEKYLDKHIMKDLASKCGFAVPEGVIINTNDFYTTAEEWEKYPAIVKPNVSYTGKKCDISIVYTRDQLSATIRKFKQSGCTNLLVEEFVGGENSFMVEVMGFSSGKKTEICGVIKKNREYPMGRGSTSFAELVELTEYADEKMVDCLVKRLSFVGLFDLELMCKDEQIYFIECNFRNGAPAYAMTRYGVNLPLTWIYSEMSLDYQIKYVKRKRKLFMCEQTDILNMLKGNVKFWTWIKQYFSSKKVFWLGNDMKPFFCYWFKMFLFLCKRKAK